MNKPGVRNGEKTVLQNTIGAMTMKEFQCGTLVPGCQFHARHDDEAEVMRKAVEHMRDTHGETIIRETMVEAIRSRITNKNEAA